MNILILGSGGREHALAWKIAQSPLCSRIYAAPGNPGTALLGENLAVNLEDFPAVAEAVKTHGIDLIVVVPEGPLVNGTRCACTPQARWASIPITLWATTACILKAA
jgi:phosphoribosylamine--glycine ligase